MFYPLAQALYYVIPTIVILLIVIFVLRGPIARFIGRTHSQMKNAHKDVLKEYRRLWFRWCFEQVETMQPVPMMVVDN